MDADEIRYRAILLMDRWREDWNLFAHDVLGVCLDSEQQKILAAVQTEPMVSVASGTARGKDFVAAVASMCFLYLTPRWNSKRQLIENTKVALTAPTDRQVKNIMMPEISRLYNRAKQRGIQLPGRLNAYDIRTDFDEWFLTGFKADEHNHEAWSGFHAVNVMFVVTEATGIVDDTFAAIEGNLQGNSRLLLVFNQNTPVGYAARSQKSKRFAKFRLNSLTAPNVIERKIIYPGQVDYEWVTDKLNAWCTPISKDEVKAEFDDFFFEGKWYRPEDLFRIKVLGKPPKIAEDILIPQQWIEEAQERWQRFKGKPSGQKVRGVDVAGMGRDCSVYLTRQDNYVHPIKKHNSGGTADHMRVAGDNAHFLDTNPGAFVSIDTIGEGAGVFSRMEELGYNNKTPKRVISCKYSEAARIRTKDLSDITGQYRFANMRAYLYWCVRDWLNPKNETGAMLPPGDCIKEEGAEIRWCFRSDGKIIIEPKEDIKKRLGRSPDEMDALANTFYPLRKTDNSDIEELKNYLY